MSLEMARTQGSGVLLPRLENILTSQLQDITRVTAYKVHVGFTDNRALYLAKKDLWQGKIVSSQVNLIEKAREKGVWICIWVANTSKMYRFNPKTILEKGWRNKRGDEEMINIDIRYGEPISELSHPDLPIPSKPAEQLIIQ